LNGDMSGSLNERLRQTIDGWIDGRNLRVANRPERGRVRC
jgi:hypothetical protein